MIIRERLWWTDGGRSGGGRLVPDGDPSAAFLAFGPGTTLTDNEAAVWSRYGLTQALADGRASRTPAAGTPDAVPATVRGTTKGK